MEKSLLLNLHIGGEERKIKRVVVREMEFWVLVRGERNINRREETWFWGGGGIGGENWPLESQIPFCYCFTLLHKQYF